MNRVDIYLNLAERPNTRRWYAAAVRHFEVEWHGLLPTTPSTIASYLAEYTLNRMCGSGQQAIHFAAQAIASGDMEVVVAGGIEVMSRVPLASDWPAEWPPDFPYPLVHQGLSAEMVAERWGFTRADLDRFAFESHVKAAAATKRGGFAQEIIPIDAPQPDGSTITLNYDEGIRFEPNLEKMRQLQPAFKPDGVVTAGKPVRSATDARRSC